MKYTYLTLDEYADLPEESNNFLIHKFLPHPGRVLLVGPQKEGKSFLGLQMGLAVAKGEPFMGRPSIKSKVLYLQYDTPHSLWLNRMKSLKKSGIIFDPNFYVLDTNNKDHKRQIDIRKNPLDIVYLQEVLEDIQPQLVIIDTLRKVYSGDENSSDIGLEVFNILNELFQKQTVVYVHHTHKLTPPPGQKIQHKISPGDACRGSSYYAGEVDAIYLLYGHRLRSECRFDEELDTHLDRDPITKLWTFPDVDKLRKQEAQIREMYTSKPWASWVEFRKHVMHTLITVPDHLIERLEGELTSSATS